MLVENGIDTLEHGTQMVEELLPLLRDNKVSWNPTLAAYYSYQYPGSRKWDAIRQVCLKAIESGVRVSAGGDTGMRSFTISDDVLTCPRRLFSR